jgi:hypothetical protein
MDDNEPLRSGNLEVTSPISATKMAASFEPTTIGTAPSDPDGHNLLIEPQRSES